MQTLHTLCLPAPAGAGPFARFVAGLIEAWRRSEPPPGQHPRPCIRSTTGPCTTSASTARRSAASPPRSAAGPRSATSTPVWPASGAPETSLPTPPPRKHSHARSHRRPRSRPRPAAGHRPLRPLHRELQADPLGHRPRRHPRPQLRLRQEVPARRPVEGRPSSPSCSRPRRGSCRRSRAAPTPTCSRWSSASSAPRRSSSAATTALGDQVALEALVRLTDEELKHQEMFRRLERMAAAGMPTGYAFMPQPNEVAAAVLCQVELGGARPDARHRAVHRRRTTARASSPTTASPSCGRTSSCSTGRKSRSTRSSTSSSGGARTRASSGAERDQRRRRPDRAGRRGRRHLPDAGQGRRRLLPARRCAARSARPRRPRCTTVVLKAYRWQYIVSGAQEPRFAAGAEGARHPGADAADPAGAGPVLRRRLIDRRTASSPPQQDESHHANRDPFSPCHRPPTSPPSSSASRRPGPAATTPSSAPPCRSSARRSPRPPTCAPASACSTSPPATATPRSPRRAASPASTSTDYVPALLDKGAPARPRRRPGGALPGRRRRGRCRSPTAASTSCCRPSARCSRPTTQRTAAEMLRVLRPGGRIGMANWTPEGFIGRLFKVIGAHVPPPAGAAAARAVGHRGAPRGAVRRGRAQIRCEQQHFNFRYRSAAHLRAGVPRLLRPDAQGLRRARRGRPAALERTSSALLEQDEHRRRGLARRAERVPRSRRHQGLTARLSNPRRTP